MCVLGGNKGGNECLSEVLLTSKDCQWMRGEREMQKDKRKKEQEKDM